jgi:hypothetical protein
MRVYLKPSGDGLDFERTCVDADVNGTVDHLISYLTLKYNSIDATTLVVYKNGKMLPFDKEIYALNIVEDDELEVRIRQKNCCSLL